MTSSFLPYLILSGLTGFHCGITTVRKMSVKAGSAISIPCLYDSSYSSHVKYLCKGTPWLSCSTAVQTNKPDETGKFSISDDRQRNIFTVVINDPDNSLYWCAVKKSGFDVKKRFWLSVTTDVPSLYVNQQEITAVEGGSVTVLCYYNEYPKEKGWCGLGSSSCVTKQTGAINGATVTINETVPNAFDVTMSGLRTENSGWYWCDNGKFQIPVHITVHEITSSTVAATGTSTERTTPKTMHFSSVPNAELNTSSPVNSTESQTGGESLQDEHKSFTKTMILIIALISLLLLVAAAVLGWRRIRCKSKPEAFDMTGDSQTGSDPNAQYAEIHHNKASSVLSKSQISEDSVTYSTIVMTDCMQQAIQPADGSVTYSTVQRETQ